MNAYAALGIVLISAQLLTAAFILAALPRLIAGSAWKVGFAGIILTVSTAIWMMRSLS